MQFSMAMMKQIDSVIDSFTTYNKLRQLNGKLKSLKINNAPDMKPELWRFTFKTV